MIPIYNKGKFVVKGAVRIDRPHLERVREPNVADVDKDQPATGDLSCWLATAANMLALKGYGDGDGLQVRANEIYATLMDDVYDGNGGFIDDGVVEALDRYATDSSNDFALMLGNRTRIPYEREGLEGLDDFIRSALDDDVPVGISISFYNSTIYGGHAVTAATIDTANQILSISDSDVDPKSEFSDAFDNRKVDYPYTIGDVTIGTTTYNKVLQFDYKGRNAFIKHICLLTNKLVGTLKLADIAFDFDDNNFAVVMSKPQSKIRVKKYVDLWQVDGPIRPEEDQKIRSKHIKN